MRDEIAIEKAEKKRRLDIIAAGVESDYWKVLKLEIEDEIKLLTLKRDALNNRKMTQKDLELRDQIIYQIEFMSKFLTINDILIERHMSYLERMKDWMNEIWNKSTSFVGKDLV